MATGNGEAAPRELNRDPITGASDAHAHVGLASGTTAGGQPGPELSNEEVIGVLEELLAGAGQSEYGFRTAAVEVQAPRVRERLAQRAADCRKGAEDLAQMITMYGGDPATGGATAGQSQPAVVEAGGAGSAPSALQACERIEDAAVARYRKALDLNLPRDVRALLQRLARDTQVMHDEIRSLRDAERTAAH